MKDRFLLAMAVVTLIGGFALTLATSSTLAQDTPPFTASGACDGDDLLITFNGPPGLFMAFWNEGLVDMDESPYRLIGPGTWTALSVIHDSSAGTMDSIFLGSFTCGGPPITARANCDGTDLIIRWSGPDEWNYTIAWGDIRAAPRTSMAVPPSGEEVVTTSPHRLTGPGTWNNLYIYGSGPDGSADVALGTFTCEAPPPPPSAACDGDDLLITFSYYRHGIGYYVSWDGIVFWESMELTPHRITGPNTWINVSVHIDFFFLMRHFSLGDFTCPDDPPAVYGCTFDGRLNDDFCGYPIAVYRVSSALRIYAIDPDTGEGTLVLDTGAEGFEYPATAIHTFTGWPVEIYELTTGEIQISTYYADGKPYIFVVSPAGNYHLAR